MRSGKYYAGVRYNGKKVDAHRLEVELAIGRKLKYDEVVHHIDGNINNNAIDNLTIMSRAEHSRLHMTGKTPSAETREKLSRALRGHVSACRKFTDEQAAEMKRLHGMGFTYREIAEKYGTDHSTILRIVNGTYYQKPNEKKSQSGGEKAAG